MRSPCTTRACTPSQIRCRSSDEMLSKADTRASLHQPVAHPPHVDDDGAGAYGRELPPQARGVRVERSRSTKRAEAPDLTQKLLLREHARRIGHQLEQELVLLARQRDRH